jgi:hypothetical protein
MWHQFHFEEVASYRYFLHSRRCRPETKGEKKQEMRSHGLGKWQGI